MLARSEGFEPPTLGIERSGSHENHAFTVITYSSAPLFQVQRHRLRHGFDRRNCEPGFEDNVVNAAVAGHVVMQDLNGSPSAMGDS